jgi:hypothetical protein
MAAIQQIANKTTDAQVWTPFIEAGAAAVMERVEEGEKLDAKLIVDTFDMMTDDFGSIFKTKRGRKAGAKNRVADDECRCCALTIKNGAPVRCTRKRAEDEGDYCVTHSKQCATFGPNTKYGRFDKEVPLTIVKSDGLGGEEEKPIAWTTPELVERMRAAGLKVKARRTRKGSDSDAESTKSKRGPRAPTAYNLFMKDHRSGRSMAEAAAMWKAVDDETKERYTKLAEEAKEAFDVEHADDVKPKKKGSKRAPTAYNLFMKDHRSGRSMAEAAAMWKEADDETKERYTKLAEEAKQAFDDAKLVLNDTDDEDAPIMVTKKAKKAKKTDGPASGAGASVAPATPKKSTKPAAPVAPVKAEPAKVEVDLDADALGEFCEEEDDMESYPTWTHRGMKKAFLVDTEEMFLYDAETKEPVCAVDAMGGEAAFDKED